MAPRPDGKPMIIEIVADDMLDDIGDTSRTGAQVVSELKAKLGELPDAEDVREYLGIDPRADKTWPPEEDCQGCDQHRNGPHRFRCRAQGGQQLRVPATVEDGQIKVKI